MTRQFLLSALLLTTPMMHAQEDTARFHWQAFSEKALIYGSHGLAIAAGAACIWGGMCTALDGDLSPIQHAFGTLVAGIGSATSLAHAIPLLNQKRFLEYTAKDLEEADRLARRDEQDGKPAGDRYEIAKKVLASRKRKK